MIAYLVAEHGLHRVEAYMLCSVAGDLKMHEVVRGRVLLEWVIDGCFHDRWICRIMSYVSCSFLSVYMVMINAGKIGMMIPKSVLGASV